MKIYIEKLHRPITHRLVKETLDLQETIDKAVVQEQQREVMRTPSI